jgi:hypothetical protein
LFSFFFKYTATHMCVCIISSQHRIIIDQEKDIEL